MQERRIHQIFEISVLLKGLNAAAEVLGGALLAVVGNGTLRQWIMRFTYGELSEDRNDFIANHLLAWAQGFSIQAQHFYIWYFASHGVVKLALVVRLLKRWLWAYPAAIVVFGLFIAYQLYRYTHTHGAALLALTALDLVVVALTWHEYRLMRRHLPVE